MNADEARANIDYDAMMTQIYEQIETWSKVKTTTRVWFVPKHLLKRVKAQLRADGFKVKTSWLDPNEFDIWW